jgi:hypothetical protein
MQLSLSIPDDQSETIMDYMYADLNPILEPYRVQSEKTLRRLLSTYFTFYFLPANALDHDNNWQQYKDLFDTIVILKCSKSRMKNFGRTYRYCIFNKSDVSAIHSYRLEAIAREKYHLDPDIQPTVSQLLDSIPGDVFPIQQTIRSDQNKSAVPNPFASRTPRDHFFSPVTLPSISYASVVSLPREPLPIRIQPEKINPKKSNRIRPKTNRKRNTENQYRLRQTTLRQRRQ